jgi:RNA polymerase sigma factor (TIGR02999 family)
MNLSESAHSHEVTQLLISWRDGDENAAMRLIPLVSDEIRHLLKSYLKRERSNFTRTPTALVREAYVRMVDDSQTSWKDRAHFYGLAARAMRQTLVDRARAHNAAKDGGVHSPGNGRVDLVELDRALERFAQSYPRKCEVVELKFFGGLRVREISEILQVSEKAVLRDWTFAKIWLKRALNGGAA